MRAFILLFCLFTTAVAAQVPYLERLAADGSFRRIDPSGILPGTINDPLPFSYGIKAVQAVSAFYSEADYFSYKNSDEGVYEYTRIVRLDEAHRILEEKRIDKFSGQTIGQIVNEYDEGDRIKNIRTYSKEAGKDLIELTSIKTFTYDSVEGILINDSTVDFVSEQVTVQKRRLIRDADNKLIALQCLSVNNGLISQQGFFEFNYRGDMLSEIIQYAQTENGEKAEAVYRYNLLSGKKTAPFEITGYTSAWMQNGKWQDFRIDHQLVKENFKVFESTLLTGADAGKKIRNEYRLDNYGNVASMSQCISFGNTSQTIGELRYETQYDDNSKTPSSITTYYLDENQQLRPSLRVTINTTRNNNHLTGNKINVFPNPATSLVNIQLEKTSDEIITIELQNLTGNTVKRIAEKSFEDNLVSLTLNDIAPGLYQIRVIYSDAIQTTPLVVLESK